MHMKHLKSSLIMLLLLCTGLLSAQNKELAILLGDQSVTRVSLDQLQKITFDATTMQIHLNTGEVSGIPMGDIRYFSFDSKTGLNPMVANGASWSVYPTHAVDWISFSSLDEGSHQVKIYSVSGQLVHEQLVNNSEEQIQINHLNKGIYVVRIGNRALKFVKE